MYIGLWSRVEGFQRDDLTRALERRAVVQGTLMRSTIHLASAGDYWPFALAILPSRREGWLRTHRGAPSARQMAALARRLRPRLADGPLRRAEIDRLLGKGSAVTNGVGLWLELVRAPPSGTWERRRADLYAAAEEWLGPAEVTPQEATELLVRRYLGGFGPASRSEIADWAGLRPNEIAPALERLRLRRFRAEDGEELLDLPRAPLPDPETPAPARFLPVWDATLLVARQANRDPAGALPAGRLQHQDPPLGAHVPGRRRGGRDLEVREGTGAAEAVRAPHRGGAARAGRGGRAAGRVSLVRGGCEPVGVSDRR